MLWIDVVKPDRKVSLDYRNVFDLQMIAGKNGFAVVAELKSGPSILLCERATQEEATQELEAIKNAAAAYGEPGTQTATLSINYKLPEKKDAEAKDKETNPVKKKE